MELHTWHTDSYAESVSKPETISKPDGETESITDYNSDSKIDCDSESITDGYAYANRYSNSAEFATAAWQHHNSVRSWTRYQIWFR